MLLLQMLLAGASFGQTFFVGAKSGIPLTDAFSNETAMGVDTTTHAYSQSKNYVIGPAAEVGLPLGFSVEVDALYRPLNLAVDFTGLVLGTVHTSTEFQSWEFPILGKYHFVRTAVVSPYVEAGPIFRTVSGGGSYLSNKGLALGGGVEIKIWKLRVMPELRYSHWGQDAAASPNAPQYPSNQNQAEFLIGFGF
jgi:hypothetical protein